MKFIKTNIALAIALATTTVNANAEDDDLAIEQIVVTAQKRQQNLQEVPIAVTALNSDDLKQAGAVTLTDVATLTPGLQISNPQAESTSITMRGIGSNDFGYSSDQSIPVYLDGVYMGSGAAIIGDLMDISQVEVLKGPQGSLFGRNAVGGAVNITTTKPSEYFEASLKLGLGNNNLTTVHGMLNLPLIDDELYLRVSGSSRDRDGWQKNIATGKVDGYAQDRWNGRAKLLWTPNEQLNVELTVDHHEENDHAGYFNVIGGFVAEQLNGFGLLSPATTNYLGNTANNSNTFLAIDFSDPANPFPIFDGPEGTPIDHGLTREVNGTALKIDYDISDSLAFSSTTAYRTVESEISEDNDGSEFLVLNVRSIMDNNELSQEFRLSGQSEKLDWFVGASAYKGDVAGRVNDSFGALITGETFDETAIVDTETESFALFGDAIWSLTDATKLTFGLRASYDKKSQEIKNPQAFGLVFASPNQLLNSDGIPDPSLAFSEESWSNISPRLVIDYSLDNKTMVFAGVSQGYKSGGFNSFPIVDFNPESATFGAVPFGSTQPFDEEKITNYEAGIKSLFLDDRLRLNASIYYYDFKDLQFLLNQEAVVKAVNAGGANGTGVDLEIMYLLTENLTVSANVAWLDAKYGEDVKNSDGSIIAHKDQELAYAPGLSGNVSIDHYLPLGEIGELRTHLNYSYTGERTHNTSSTAEVYTEDALGILNARMSLISANDDWELALWATNLTDENTIESFGGVTDDFGFISVRRGEPKMFGLEFSYFY